MSPGGFTSGPLTAPVVDVASHATAVVVFGPDVVVGGGATGFAEPQPAVRTKAASAGRSGCRGMWPTVQMARFAPSSVAVRAGLSPSGVTIGAVATTPETPHLVIIEDDAGIGSSLARTLQGQGYDVSWATTAAAGLTAVRSDTALVILDLGLPDQDGLDVCRALRDTFPTPQVLILTARSEEADVVLGLDAGADDYLVKPFRLAELLARVRTCTRRVDRDRDQLVIGDLTVDVDTHVVAVAGQEVALRPKEFDLLVALARNAGRVVTRERLLEQVWDEHWYGSTKTLDIHIWALRRKLDRPDRPGRITTVRGVGYKLGLP